MPTYYLQRHGIALPATGDQADDARALSDVGRQQLIAAARGLERARVCLQAILHSPARRTQQTAKLMSPLLAATAPGSRPQPCAALVPLVQMGPLHAALAAAATPTLLVGHLPDLMELLAAWCPPAAGDHRRAFAPGQLACVSFAQAPARGGGQLLWTLDPQAQAQLQPGDLPTAAAT